jgi:hypothetical protein
MTDTETKEHKKEILKYLHELSVIDSVLRDCAIHLNNLHNKIQKTTTELIKMEKERK